MLQSLIILDQNRKRRRILEPDSFLICSFAFSLAPHGHTDLAIDSAFTRCGHSRPSDMNSPEEEKNHNRFRKKTKFLRENMTGIAGLTFSSSFRAVIYHGHMTNIRIYPGDRLQPYWAECGRKQPSSRKANYKTHTSDCCWPYRELLFAHSFRVQPSEQKGPTLVNRLSEKEKKYGGVGQSRQSRRLWPRR